MLPHSFGEWKTAKPASCEEKGTEERKCSVCGKTETRETAALGHDYGEAVVTRNQHVLKLVLRLRHVRNVVKKLQK